MPDPVSGPGQILLKVEAAGVNYVDIMRRRGDPLHEPTPLPATVGYEMAGTVAGLGTGVTLPGSSSMRGRAPMRNMRSRPPRARSKFPQEWTRSRSWRCGSRA
ncbi:MAG: alcohol dehydrogenase catalytic domain-containing protein [Candidatus Binataceae bacterium]